MQHNSWPLTRAYILLYKYYLFTSTTCTGSVSLVMLAGQTTGKFGAFFFLLFFKEYLVLCCDCCITISACSFCRESTGSTTVPGYTCRHRCNNRYLVSEVSGAWMPPVEKTLEIHNGRIPLLIFSVLQVADVSGAGARPKPSTVQVQYQNRIVQARPRNFYYMIVLSILILLVHKQGKRQYINTRMKQKLYSECTLFYNTRYKYSS